MGRAGGALDGRACVAGGFVSSARERDALNRFARQARRMGEKVRIEQAIDRNSIKANLTEFPGGGILVEASLREANIKLLMKIDDLKKALVRMEEWKAGVNASLRSRRIEIAAAVMAAHIGRSGFEEDQQIMNAAATAVYVADCVIDELLLQVRTAPDDEEHQSLEAEAEKIADDIAILIGEENLR